VITTILGTIPGLIVGAYLRVKYLTDPRNFKLFVGLVLLYIVLKLIKDVRAKETKSKNNNNFRVNILCYNIRNIEFEFNDNTYKVSSGLLFLLTLFVGVIGGVYGIGGGAIIAPFLIAVLGLPVYAVAGAALFGTFFSSVAGVIIYSYLLPFIIHPVCR